MRAILSGPVSVRGRLACLDGLRGALALMVAVIHVGQRITYPAPVQGIVASLGDGGLAVALFFALSGMVIFNSIASFQGQPWPFLLARCARIFPAYLVALAASLPVADGVTPLWEHLAAHLTMIHGLFPRDVLRGVDLSILQPAWSLSTEFQFYAVMAGLVAVCGVHRWQAVSVFMLIGLAGLWFGRGFTPAFLPNVAQYFALGIGSSALFSAPGRSAGLGFLAALAGCVAITLLQGAPPKLLVPIGWAVVIAAQLRPRGALMPVSAVLSSAPLQWLGKVSYSLYLIHFPVLLAFARLWHPDGGSQAWLHGCWIAAYFAAALLAAAILQTFVEAPVSRQGHAAAKRLVRVPGLVA